jgi:protein tyrosine/serine phosphatase
MKRTWNLLFVLCVSLLASAGIARCDALSSAPQPIVSLTPDGLTSLKQAWLASPAPTRPLKESGLRNFGKLNDNIWRSGQLNRGEYQKLAAQGLKTVINLRSEYPQDQKLVPDGVNYVYIPIKNDTPPTEEQAKQFMETVSNPANWPILFHCTAGSGRTGTMAALIRHSMDNWNHDDIMKELNNFLTARMVNSQKQFIQEWEATPGLIVAP